MFGFLWEMRPYFRQVAGQLVLGSVAGIVMNTAVVLPAILLGRAIDRALSLGAGRSHGRGRRLGRAGLRRRHAAHRGASHREALVADDGQREDPRERTSRRLPRRARRGRWPICRRTPIGDLMARIVGDVEVLGVGRPRVHHRDLGHRALLPLLRRGDARLRSGPHAAGALAGAAGHGPRARDRPLGRRANHERARGERRSHLGDPGASGGHQGVAPLRPGQRVGRAGRRAVAAGRGEEPEPRSTQGRLAADLHHADDRRRALDRLAG